MSKEFVLKYPEPYFNQAEQFFVPSLVEVFPTDELAWAALRTAYKNAGLIIDESGVVIEND